MQTLLSVLQVLIALGMVAMILVQRGAGASAGASFGAGASATVFGSQGAGSFMTRATAVLATGFFVVTLGMAIIAGRSTAPVDQDDLGVMSGVTEQQQSPAGTEAGTDPLEVPVLEESTVVVDREMEVPVVEESATMDVPPAAGEEAEQTVPPQEEESPIE